ncbi:hypothetical protein [Flavobacterium sp. CECT 9288]|uniref:hypothetical protein n=1 Tax=Flavobacterium sp. CECT 9288 TaxID=2845819 RepID=UPI001E38C342|nr:hypothetical protein [Flavobacterium sp. CECT 9288]
MSLILATSLPVSVSISRFASSATRLISLASSAVSTSSAAAFPSRAILDKLGRPKEARSTVTLKAIQP